MIFVDLYSLKKTFNDSEILMCFAGPFSQSIIEELGNAVKRYLEAAQLTKTSLMDVFSIFVEQTQNVRNYAARKSLERNTDVDFNSAIVIIGKTEDRHLVSSGNIVDRNDIRMAIGQLDALRDLDRSGLKAIYRERIRGPRSGPGAGLGLIDMSRKVSQPLQYMLQDVDDRYCFFSLRAVV